MHFCVNLPTSSSGCSQMPLWNQASEENSACLVKLKTSEPVVYKPHMVLEAPRNNDERKSLKPRRTGSVQLYFPLNDSANCVSSPLFTEPCYVPSIIWCLSFNPHNNQAKVTFPCLSRKWHWMQVNLFQTLCLNHYTSLPPRGKGGRRNTENSNNPLLFPSILPGHGRVRKLKKQNKTNTPLL